MTDAVILSAVRTPIGRFQGTLAHLSAPQLGAIAVAQRAWANLNPAAQMHDTPMTMEDYLSVRMISDPFCLYDCDVPVDGSTASLAPATRTFRLVASSD